MASASDTRVPRSRVLSAVAVAILAGLLVGLVLGGPVLGLGSPGAGVPTPTASPTDVQFTAVTEGYDDRLVFRFRPDDRQPREYRVTYELREGGNTAQQAQNRSVTLSTDDPFVLTVEDRQANTEYVLDIEVFRNERRVYEGRIAISQPRATTAN